MIDEEDVIEKGPEKNASSPNISPLKTMKTSYTKGNEGTEGVNTITTEQSPRDGLSPVMTQRKARQLERERKRQV